MSNEYYTIESGRFVDKVDTILKSVILLLKQSQGLSKMRLDSLHCSLTPSYNAEFLR